MRSDEHRTRLDLSEVWGILFFRWRVIATAVAATLMIGLLTSWNADRSSEPVPPPPAPPPDRYEATAVYTLVPEGEGLAADERVRLAQALAPTYQVILFEQSFLAALVNDLDLTMSASEVRSGLKLTIPPGTTLLQISATADTPDDAISIANGFGDALSRRLGPGGLDIGVVSVRLAGLYLAESANAIVSPAPASAVVASAPRVNPIALFTIIGVVIGVLGAFIVEWAEGKSHRTAQVEEETGLRLLGKLDNRKQSEKGPLVQVSGGSSEGAETFRAMKSRLKLIDRPSGQGRSILVTSPNAGAGKTTIVGNLAPVLAEDGSSVVVVSADLRSIDSLERFWPQSSDSAGLSDYLSDPDLPVDKVLSQTSEDRVTLITRGSSPETAIPLLDSRRMTALIETLSARFDWVLVDSPAVLGTTDAARLAPCIDGTLLVVDGAHGTMASVQAAARFLDDTGARLVGFFHNRTRRNPVDRILRRPTA